MTLIWLYGFEGKFEILLYLKNLGQDFNGIWTAEGGYYNHCSPKISLKSLRWVSRNFDLKKGRGVQKSRATTQKVKPIHKIIPPHKSMINVVTLVLK